MKEEVLDAYDIVLESKELFSSYLDDNWLNEEKYKKLQYTLNDIIKKIDDEKALLIHLLDNMKTESDRLYEKAIGVLEKAHEVHDDDMVNVTSNFVATIYNEHFIYKK